MQIDVGNNLPDITQNYQLNLMKWSDSKVWTRNWMYYYLVRLSIYQNSQDYWISHIKKQLFRNKFVM